jgi:hypothetical protein
LVPAILVLHLVLPGTAADFLPEGEVAAQDGVERIFGLQQL